MKKLLAIALLLLVGLTASAQGGWRVSHREADPLKGQSAKDVYIYDDLEVGSLVVWDWGKPDFRLITDKGMFMYSRFGMYTTVVVNVGFYDDKNNMEEMLYLTLSVEPNHSYQFIATDRWGRKKIKKVLARLRSDKGYVRFVAKRFDMTDFDLIVEPFKEE